MQDHEFKVRAPYSPLGHASCRVRNRAEHSFDKLKNTRWLAPRYDKTADRFLGFVDMDCIRLWSGEGPC